MFIFNLKSGLQPWVAQTRRGRFLYALAWMSGVVTLALSSVVYSQPVVEAERIIGARVIEGPVFVDASSNNFPPINYLSEDGELLGFGQELAQAVLGATGARVQHKHSDRWPEVVGWVESGEADFIHNIGYTPEREKTLDYTTPIFSMPEVIFVQDEHLDIQSFEDVIRDGSVACVRENITHQYLKRFKEITCKIYETPLAALKGLVNGEVHSLIFPKQVIQYLAQRYDLSPYIKIVGDPLRTLQWSMAVKKGNAAMQERLNRGLARVRESGEYQRIYDRHFGQKVLLGYSQLQVALASALASMVSVLLVGGALVAWFIRRLRRDKQVVEQNIAERMATEAQLRESEYQLRHVADNLPTTILITRQSDGTILYGNPAAESILGLPPSAFLGRRSTEFYAEPEQRTAVIEELKTKGNIRGLAMVVKRPNGDRVEVVLDLQPMFYLGEPALLLTAHDITKRVQTEQEREKLLVQMGARIRELACLYHISSLVRAGGSLAEVLRSAVEVLPLGFQHPQQTGVRIRFGHEEFQSGPLPKTPHVLSVQLRVGERVEGTVEVFAWGDSISPGKEFLDEERALLNGVSDTLAEFISRRRAEEALHLGTRMSGLMQRISVAANASDHQNQAFHACLQEVCAFTGWQVGHVYLVEGEDSDLLRPSGVWHLADPERFTTFKEVTLQTTFRRGEGLPGRVLESGRPLWIPNVLRDEGFLRAKHHGDLHVRTGVGFPVFTGEMVSAVVEFFSPEETSENPGLIEMLGHIGMVLGRVMERNRAERALLDAQINLSVASHLAKLGSWELNTETGSLRVSEEVLSILGVQGGSLEPTVEAFLGVVHPEDREDVSARLRISTKTGSDFEVEHRVLLPTGEVRTVINKAEVFQNLSGTVVRMIGALQDISSRKLAEVELRNSENRFRLLIEGSIQGVSVHRDGRLLFVNKALADMFGYHSVEEMLSMGMIDRLLHSEEQPRMQEYEKLRLEGGPAPRAYVFKGVRADNTSVWISNQVSVVDWNGQQAILSTMFDVSEQHRLEEQLRQAQKMEAVGLLAGGVAHDFNNMLQIISGYTQMALQHKDNVTKMESDLGRALAASHSAADLTRQLLAFSRQEVLTRKSLDLGHQVSQRMKMIRRLIGEDIELKIDTGLEALMVNGDLGALDQVVMNLCLNARDAMPHGGALSISTIKVFPTDTQLKSLGKTAGLPYALLIVSDTGVGMKPEVQERIFEPFFTTKGPERGTGLGLSTVYGIVRKHGGWIEVESSLGKGSKFRVFLPLIQEERRPESLQAPTEDWDRIATETILIGEDDMGVRLLTKEILESKGYRVLDAGDGAETLEVFKAHRNEIDMVLLDMVMPKISGRDVYEEIRAASPSVPVVFSTGYTNQMVDTEYLETHKLTLMQKPYSPSQLFRTIREVLAK